MSEVERRVVKWRREWLSGNPSSVLVIASPVLQARMASCPADISTAPCECGVHKALEQLKEAMKEG